MWTEVCANLAISSAYSSRSLVPISNSSIKGIHPYLFVLAFKIVLFSIQLSGSAL